MPELLIGVEFSMGRNGPDLYLKALEKLQLYESKTYKNGAEVQKCLKQEKLITFMAPELGENATATQKEMWKIRANNTIKREELLEANLEAMCKVAMSICNPVLKYQICNHEGYEEINNKQDTLGLLKIVKKNHVLKWRGQHAHGLQSRHSHHTLLLHTEGEIPVTTRIP